MSIGIMVFGLNGSGKSTLAKALSYEIGYKYMDIEDYVFKNSDIPYSLQRTRDEYIYMMEEDIRKHKNFVMAAVRGNFGDPITSLFKLAVFIDVPYDIRVKRVEDRMVVKFGDRVKVGGDMYESEMIFLDFVKNRKMDKLNVWKESLKCPVISIDGTLAVSENVALVKEYIETYI